jgi:poly-beta-hydroxybutyrate-responsive repressor
MSEPERKPKSEKTPVPQVGNKNSVARPRHWLEPAILVTLREWNLCGYKLMEQLTAFGFEAMNPGTMYRTLRQMEENGVVKSKWETSQGGQHVECTPSHKLERHTSTCGQTHLSSTSRRWTRSSRSTQVGRDGELRRKSEADRISIIASC